MTLSEIAAGLEVTERQRERGVATVDDTDADLTSRLEPYAEELPCDAASAAAIVDAYTAGTAIGECARAAGVAPATAARTLHLLGVEGVSPLTPVGRDVLRDWLAGECSRTEAKRLVDASEPEFALAAFVETHDPIEGAREAVEGIHSPEGDATVEKRDALDGTMTEAGDFL